MSFHVPQPTESFLTNATLKRCLTSMGNTDISLMIDHRNIFHIFHIYMALILNALSLHVSSYSLNDWTFHHIFHKHKNSFGQVFAFCNLPNDYLVMILLGLSIWPSDLSYSSNRKLSLLIYDFDFDFQFPSIAFQSTYIYCSFVV